MGKKWSTVSVSGYKALTVADDGSAVEGNRVKYSTIYTDLTDPIKTGVDSIVSGLDELFTEATTPVASAYTTVATDHATWLEVTGTTTVTLLAAATAGAGYKVGVKNAGVATVTVARSGADTIDGATSKSLAAKDSAMYVVNAAGDGYIEADKSSATAINNILSDRDGSLVTAGTEPAYTLTTNQTITSYAAGDTFRFRCHSGNESATKSPSVITSINVDGLGVKEIVSVGNIELPAFSLTTGGIYTIVYSTTYAKFVCLDYLQLTPKVTVFTSDGTWTKSAGMQRIIIDVLAGGGGGGGSQGTSANEASAGAGGGGGGYGYEVIQRANVTDTVTVTVGTGGAGGAIGSSGSNGTNTSFGAYVTATAGAGGGFIGAGTDYYYASPGGGGSFSSTYSGAGGRGEFGSQGERVGSTVQSSTQKALGGKGGSGGGPFGGGGGGPVFASGATSTAGKVGLAFGSGGGGAATAATSSGGTTGAVGGAGYDGIVVVTEYFS